MSTTWKGRVSCVERNCVLSANANARFSSARITRLGCPSGFLNIAVEASFDRMGFVRHKAGGSFFWSTFHSTKAPKKPITAKQINPAESTWCLLAMYAATRSPRTTMSTTRAYTMVTESVSQRCRMARLALFTLTPKVRGHTEVSTAILDELVGILA